MENKRILVLAPHTDDGEFGCGGSIAKFTEEGAEVHYVAFSTARESVPDDLPDNILEIEVKEATRRLGIKPENLYVYGYKVRKLNYVRQDLLEEMVKLRTDIQPDMVFMPSVHDTHQDHYTVAMEGLRAFKQTTVLGYEVPWNNFSFRTQSFIKLEERHIETKIHALDAYESQKHRSYANAEFIWSLARGVQIGSTAYAETFEVVRWII